MNAILEEAGKRYANKNKYKALNNIRNHINKLPLSNSESKEELKNQLISFLVICMQKRTNPGSWSPKTKTGEYVITLLNSPAHKQIVTDSLADLNIPSKKGKVEYKQLALALSKLTLNQDKIKESYSNKNDQMTITRFKK